jgi:ketosteroid isomerase-like protein/uncharacterized protein YndB with AHSA1/START domain
MSPEETLEIVRSFRARPARVFRQWVQPDNLAAWFAPDGHTVQHVALELRAGGAWEVAYRSDAGVSYLESGVFVEVLEPERLVFTLSLNGGPQTRVTVTFTATEAGTEMIFRQTGLQDRLLREAQRLGWLTCFRKLEDHMSDEEEIRELFVQWWRDAAAKDLDAVMRPIAPDVHAYEHEAPLQYQGQAALRETCRQGFEKAQGDFTWDIPDLQILVRGDLAVTWGLNRMRAQVPGQPVHESWSRGTRVFRKLHGQWKLVHQHVSFPFDPDSGLSRMDLRP